MTSGRDIRGGTSDAEEISDPVVCCDVQQTKYNTAPCPFSACLPFPTPEGEVRPASHLASTIPPPPRPKPHSKTPHKRPHVLQYVPILQVPTEHTYSAHGNTPYAAEGLHSFQKAV